jgi:5-methylcytosine-specific restriction endonuclease McrA
MKRGTFKKKSYEEVLEAKRAKVPKPIKKRATGRLGGNKRKVAGLPSWLKAIPESQAHGSGTYQKRLWKLTSDYVRIRDWHLYKVCSATGKRIESWQDGQAGHLKPYSKCNALFKFDLRNIHMQSASSNKWGNFDTFRDYEKVVRNRRYDFDAFERENNKANGASLRDSEVLNAAEKLLTLMKDLPEQPEYFERAYILYEKYKSML